MRKLATLTTCVLTLLILCTPISAEFRVIESTYTSGNYYRIVRQDPMTDEVELNLFLFDNQYNAEKLSNLEDASIDDMKKLGVKILHIMKTKDTDPVIIVWWPEQLKDGSTVRWRFDKNEVQTASWAIPTNNLIFLTPHNSIQQFVRKLVESDRLAVEAVPYQKTVLKETVVAVFELDGLAKSAQPYLQQVNWKL